MNMLISLTDDMKIRIINKLSESLMTNKKPSDSNSLFNQIRGSWKNDGMTVEEEIEAIHSARTNNSSRIIEEL